MEASVRTPRKLDSEKAQRIVEAMRASVGVRGAAGATFDHVAQEAGVSRGLLHYYFGSKERLLVEVVRRDCDIRLGRLEERLAGADSVDGIIDVLVSHLEDFLEQDPAASALVYELFTASRHNEDLQEAMAELYREVRSHVAGVLEEKERQGVVRLRGDAEAVASILFALGDGIALQRLSDPSWDSAPTFETGIQTAGFLLRA
ncbi:MAG: TetR/AcrR family transcriptional regulator [Thermoleophilaceae bacterium]